MKTKVNLIKGKKLHFIARIERDGSGVVNVENEDHSFIDNDLFKITCLSMSQGTFIASEFNSYVVKYKKQIGL